MTEIGDFSKSTTTISFHKVITVVAIAAVTTTSATVVVAAIIVIGSIGQNTAILPIQFFVVGHSSSFNVTNPTDLK
ncbi:Hypothetical predicted protein [Octopus vulgaris]|uniref:Transmembrane protein n=1 Tax=Octopus vulgaris TaxID=6645 RepID=A0AA36AQ81_OCTVU|nr:Hypothetical predicted protein [Octopus vulgaris]